MGCLDGTIIFTNPGHRGHNVVSFLSWQGTLLAHSVVLSMLVNNLFYILC